MKTYKSAKDVKDALLQGKEVVINKWSALINNKDEVEIWDPKGEGVVASLMNLDKACQDFVKYAQGIPETMPKPISYPATPSGNGPLGPDSSGDKPWTDPKVNKTPVMQGPTSDPKLKNDTSMDSPWTDPAINTRPQPDIGRGGLPDTELGPDSTKNEVSWADKLTGPGSQQGQFESGSNKAAQDMDPGDSGKEEMGTSDPDGEFYPELEYEPHQIENQGETPSSLPDDLGGSVNAFVDTFDKDADIGLSYQDLVNASPSRDLLKDIADPERWATGQALGSFATGLGRGLFRDDDDCRDEATTNMRGNPPGEAEAGCDYPEKDKKKSRKVKAGPRLKENWGNDGVYSRDLEAESAEELYHLTRSFGSEDDYDWSGMRPAPAEAMEGDPAAEAMPLEARKAVDEEAKSYWTDFFNDYGEDMVKDDSTKKNRGEYEPTVDETPTPAGQQSVKSRRRAQYWDEQTAAVYDSILQTPNLQFDLVKQMMADPTNSATILQQAVSSTLGDVQADWEALSDQLYSDYESAGAGEAQMNPYHTQDEQVGMPTTPTNFLDNPVDWVTEKGKGIYNEMTASERKVRKGQAAPAAPPESAPPGGMPAAPESAPQGVPAAPGAQPPAGPVPKAPGAGDAGLKALGWTDQDIKAMDEESKQKILQVQLKKPGAGAPAAGAPTGVPGAPAPAKPPAKPAPQAPQSGPAPMPAPPGQGMPAPVARRVEREARERKQRSKAFKMLTGQVPAEQAPPPAPNTSPSAPVQTGPASTWPDLAPSTSPTQKVEDFQSDVSNELSPESQAMQIYNEILQDTVQASFPEQVPALKAQTLIQRLLTETGMPVQEARNLFGLKAGDGFNKLFN